MQNITKFEIMKRFIIPVLLLSIITACHSQDRKHEKHQNTVKQSAEKHVGGRCEGCEAIYEYGDKKLLSVDTLPDFHEEGPKLKVTGTIYQNDGKTPAKDVIMYLYHTDQTGIYPTKGGETGWARRHGYIRGWIKTDENGKYTFYTLKPASYPTRQEPAHIHAIIKEPRINEYYLSDYLFAGDPLLTKDEPAPRGGSGVLTLTEKNGLSIGVRDIILGLNVPEYNE